MLLFTTGALCIGLAGTMVVTARLLNRIDHLEEKIKDLQTNLKDICKDINYVERTIMNKINTVDEVHTKVEEEIKAVLTGSMKGSKQLLKG
jgi:archaellum component FlaC